MNKKSERIEIRLTKQELSALERLAKKAGYKFRSEWIAMQIEQAAKRSRVWK